MALKPWSVLKSILIQNGSDRTKSLSLSIDDSAVTNTSTVLNSKQTVNRTLDLPDVSGTLVELIAAQILQNKTIDGDLNAIIDLSLASLKTNISDANKFLVRDVSGNAVSNTKIVPSGVVVGTTDTQTLLNKTLTSPVITSPIGLAKLDVGLGNVDNTSDVTKNAATATLTNKTLTSPVINSPTGIVKGDVGLGNVDNTSDVNKPVSTAQATSISNAITTAQSTSLQKSANLSDLANVVTAKTNLALTKSDVGLSNVDNTSDATKNSATATLTNKTLTTPAVDILAATQQGSVPSTPGAGVLKIYAKNDGKLYTVNSAGVELEVGGTASANPTGTVLDFAGATAPAGYLLCFGQTISRTTYIDLFTLVSTTYGVGDGSTTFNLPDLRGRVTAGKDDMGGSSAFRLTNPVVGLTLGASGGLEYHQLTISELASHTHIQSAHKHSTGMNLQAGGVVRYGTESVSAGNYNIDNDSGGFANNGNSPYGSSVIPPALATAGLNAAHNNTQPTFILNKIIKF